MVVSAPALTPNAAESATGTCANPEQPLASVPTTVYIVVAVGNAVVVEHVLQVILPDDGVHEYDTPPEANKLTA
jgi:hypothetical protein